MSPVKLVGGVGALAVFAVSALLVLEKGRHAETRSDLAAARTMVADVRAREADAAAAAARTVAAAAAAAQEDLDRQLEREAALRVEYAAVVRQSQEFRTAADRQIARLRRENAEVAAWAATVIPGPWVDFMRVRPDAAAGSGDRGRGAGDSVPGPSP